MIQALHEALMRQDDLLAYIDREEDEKYHKVNHLISFTHPITLNFVIVFLIYEENTLKWFLLGKQKKKVCW